MFLGFCTDSVNVVNPYFILWVCLHRVADLNTCYRGNGFDMKETQRHVVVYIFIFQDQTETRRKKKKWRRHADSSSSECGGTKTSLSPVAQALLLPHSLDQEPATGSPSSKDLNLRRQNQNIWTGPTGSLHLEPDQTHLCRCSSQKEPSRSISVLKKLWRRRKILDK